MDEQLKDTNIDFYHLYQAYDCIRSWFDKFGSKRQHVANKFYGHLFDHVKVIWYEVPPEQDSIELFTRLNIGRIALTDAELVKALLLSKSKPDGRDQELALQWDSIERDLRYPDIWAFISDKKPEDCPTRIDLLLDAIAGEPPGVRRPLYYTFDKLREKIEKDHYQNVWNEIVGLHALVMGWYETRKLYHKIGYLIAVGESFTSLVSLAKGSTKKHFESHLCQRICDRLELTPSAIDELSYLNQADYRKSEQLLLLMNVETIARVEPSSERYPFNAHRAEAWSLEHIHAQNADSLTRIEQWRPWLNLHGQALAELPVDGERLDRRNILLAEIKSALEDLSGPVFYRLQKQINDFFTSEDETQSMHSISNLALLTRDINSALGKSVFEVKRRDILRRDRAGKYIPICTRHVFLKYYTIENAQQVHFWGVHDREGYLARMKEIVAPYLQEEPKS